MFADIKNFITVKYDRKKVESPPPWLDLPTKSLANHIEVQDKLFWQLAKQIRLIYPQATLHVITNQDHENRSRIIFHKLPIPSSHLAKLYMYGLIDEPAMYIDSDILIVSKFLQKHIDINGPFNFYGKSGAGVHSDMQLHASKPLPVKMNFIYNAGLVWVSNPSQKIVEEMRSLHEKYFSDKKIEQKIGFEIADEHCSTLYAHLHNVPMKFFKDVNVMRTHIKNTSYPKAQTIHYTGYNLENKELCFQEFSKYSYAYRSIM